MVAATADITTPAVQAQRRARRLRLVRFALCFGPPFLYLLVFMILPYARIFQFSFWRTDPHAVSLQPLRR